MANNKKNESNRGILSLVWLQTKALAKMPRTMACSSPEIGSVGQNEMVVVSIYSFEYNRHVQTQTGRAGLGLSIALLLPAIQDLAQNEKLEGCVSLAPHGGAGLEWRNGNLASNVFGTTCGSDSNLCSRIGQSTRTNCANPHVGNWKE